MGLIARTTPPTKMIVYASVATASVSLIAVAILYWRLRRTEKRLQSAEGALAKREAEVAAKSSTARARAAIGAREMLAEWDKTNTGVVHARDITDGVRGRRDPLSPWAAQKSKWPPQRVRYLAERFGDGERLEYAQLENMCHYIHLISAEKAAEELGHAWEQVEKLRHKTNARESLLPASQLRGLA